MSFLLFANLPRILCRFAYLTEIDVKNGSRFAVLLISPQYCTTLMFCLLYLTKQHSNARMKALKGFRKKSVDYFESEPSHCPIHQFAQFKLYMNF